MAVTKAISHRTGVCFKAQHARAVFETAPNVGFFEVHAENYMGAGGPPHAQLTALRADYPVSVHGVGLSIGGDGSLDEDHLARLKVVVDRYEPALVSEHLAWSTHADGYLNDLLAVPYTDEILATVVDHIDHAQETLGRRILLENPATYIRFHESTLDEVDFIAEVQRRSGCGLLLDVNNVEVSAVNHGLDAEDYLRRFPIGAVEEVHLAGYDEAVDGQGRRFLIDAHSRAPAPGVMALYAGLIRRAGPIPTLLEWDADVPDWRTLIAEAARIQDIVSAAHPEAAKRHVA